MSTHEGPTEGSVGALIGTTPSAGHFQSSAIAPQYSLSQFRSPAQYHRHSITNSKSVNAAQNMDNSQYMSVPVPVVKNPAEIEIAEIAIDQEEASEQPVQQN
tara:strand:+ start:890 stop:1195 length:306 start_codon:yes stop_codon:yes gene_type:complete